MITPDDDTINPEDNTINPEDNTINPEDDTINPLQDNATKKPHKKRRKLTADVIIIPTYDSYTSFQNQKFTAVQLKKICRHYNLSVTGNKQVLMNTIYKHLYLSFNAAIIQRFWRKHYVKRYAKLHGPARFKRHLCVNETDFFTMDAVKDIPYAQFFSFKDTDNMIYGFDIMSLYNLFTSSHERHTRENDTSREVLNPYTRNPLSRRVKRDFKSLLFLSDLLKEDIQLIINEPEENKVISNNNNNNNNNYNIEYRAIALFNEMDRLGNYTNPMWFLGLRRAELLVYIRELYDIWMYRAQLTDQLKYEICPEGSPFTNTRMNDFSELSLRELQNSILLIMEAMVKNGINQHSCYLGSTYVLCAITLVSNSAAEALPWLYESVAVYF